MATRQQRKHRSALINTLVRIRRERPDLTEPEIELAAGRVVVGGARITNPRTLVRADAPLALDTPAPLRGTRKLEAALAAFAVDVRDRVALDLGASTGGFTIALLGAGARRVYAVDAGHGQLLGRLRQDPRVVNLERTNLGELDRARVPEPAAVVTMDLSYLAIARAIEQLGGVGFAPDADLIALVKPMFELALARAPTDDATVAAAIAHARAGLEASGWRVMATTPSPIAGGRGAVEAFVHARRSG